MTGGKRKESKKERSCRESNPSPLTWVTSIVNTKLQTPALTILRMHCTGSTDCLCHTPGSYSLCAVRTWLLEVNCKSFSVRRAPMAWATSVVISGHWSFLISFSTFINWLMSSQAPHVSMKEISMAMSDYQAYLKLTSCSSRAPRSWSHSPVLPVSWAKLGHEATRIHQQWILSQP